MFESETTTGPCRAHFRVASESETKYYKKMMTDPRPRIDESGEGV